MVFTTAAVSADVVGRTATTGAVLTTAASAAEVSAAEVSATEASEVVVSIWTTATGVVDSTTMVVDDEATVGSAEGWDSTVTGVDVGVPVVSTEVAVGYVSTVTVL